MSSINASALVDEFACHVVAENPVHASFMQSSLQSLREDTRAELADYLSYCLSSGLKLKYLVESYNTIVQDTLTEQLFFQQNKRYRWSRFHELADSVYFDDAYMRKYMYGLAITSFLWPNHVLLHDFFRRTFPSGREGTYLEIGPGHGYYFMASARLGRFEHLLGVDISATSATLTRDIIRYFGIDNKRNVEIIETDFLTFRGGDKKYSCIVMGEVLEHVEEPSLFLSTIARLADSSTHIFITTCLNAAAIDHIFLFRTAKELEDLISSNGLDIVESCYVPYTGKTLAQCEKWDLPVNAGYVLRRRPAA